jgi:hypothetical protein
MNRRQEERNRAIVCSDCRSAKEKNKRSAVKTVKKVFVVALAILMVTATLHAQRNEGVELPVEQIEADIIRMAKPSSGDYYQGYTRKLTYDRMVPPYGLEVTFEKTVCAHKGA